MKRQQKTLEEVTNLIGIGFCQPNFYKPSAWQQAKRIMDFLVNLEIGVIPHDFGRGKGKYSMIKGCNFSNKELAEIYIKNKYNK